MHWLKSGFVRKNLSKLSLRKKLEIFYIKVKSVSDSEVKPGMFIKNPISIQISSEMFHNNFTKFFSLFHCVSSDDRARFHLKNDTREDTPVNLKHIWNSSTQKERQKCRRNVKKYWCLQVKPPSPPQKKMNHLYFFVG